jgi:predicted enzyme related to lactoylglutathione lyase
MAADARAEGWLATFNRHAVESLVRGGYAPASTRREEEESMPRILGVFPKLLVRDVGASLRHYRDVCGFQISNSSGEPPLFGIVERDGCGLHIKRGEPRTRRSLDEAWDAYFEVEGVDALHAELLAQGARVVRGPETMPYGAKEFDIMDPDGYVLCFAGEA